MMFNTVLRWLLWWVMEFPIILIVLPLGVLFCIFAYRIASKRIRPWLSWLVPAACAAGVVVVEIVFAFTKNIRGCLPFTATFVALFIGMLIAVLADFAWKKGKVVRITALGAAVVVAAICVVGFVNYNRQAGTLSDEGTLILSDGSSYERCMDCPHDVSGWCYIGQVTEEGGFTMDAYEAVAADGAKHIRLLAVVDEIVYRTVE
ncbi:MAG: hypothetical protein IJ493_12660 [Clostridia bacterium]|nr:hypothetical protein [Clostridia bacterium]